MFAYVKKRNSEGRHTEMGQFLHTHASSSLEATTVTISVLKSYPAYGYNRKYVIFQYSVDQFWTLVLDLFNEYEFNFYKRQPCLSDNYIPVYCSSVSGLC